MCRLKYFYRFFQVLACKRVTRLCTNEDQSTFTGTAFGGPADSYGLLPIATLDRSVIALDGGLHRIARALGGLRAAVMLHGLIVRRGDRRIERARDGADIVETGAQLITRHHHTVRYTHRRYTRRLSLEVQVTHLRVIRKMFSATLLDVAPSNATRREIIRSATKKKQFSFFYYCV